VDLSTPISYFDRLRIRTPGDTSFTLGPHIDGGSIERWEDKAFRRVWSKVLEGGSKWKQHDPFDASPRLDANQDLYNAPSVLYIIPSWDDLDLNYGAIETNAAYFAAGKVGHRFRLLALAKALYVCFPCCHSRPRTFFFALSSAQNCAAMIASLLMTGRSTLRALPFLEV
jgi:hypothetical protein